MDWGKKEYSLKVDELLRSLKQTVLVKCGICYSTNYFCRIFSVILLEAELTKAGLLNRWCKH